MTDLNLCFVNCIQFVNIIIVVSSDRVENAKTLELRIFMIAKKLKI